VSSSTLKAQKFQEIEQNMESRPLKLIKILCEEGKLLKEEGGGSSLIGMDQRKEDDKTRERGWKRRRISCYRGKCRFRVRGRCSSLDAP
jgi:hypothetical protein